MLQNIILHRRDVRGNRFVDRPLEPSTIDQIITAGLHAPSVGFSQPWEFVVVTDKDVRSRVRESFDEANAAATEVFADREYARLKLEGNTAEQHRAAARPRQHADRGMSVPLPWRGVLGANLDRET